MQLIGRFLGNSTPYQWGWPGCGARIGLIATRQGSLSAAFMLNAPGRQISLLVQNPKGETIGSANNVQSTTGWARLSVQWKSSVDSFWILTLLDHSDDCNGICALGNCELDGCRESALPQRLLIEFIGDSWTAGWGCRSSDIQDSDCQASFAALAAHALDADYSLVAASGNGLVKNFGGPVPSHPNLTDLYNRTLPALDKLYQPPRPADLCVLLAGENDFSFAPYPSDAQLLDALRRLATQVFHLHPGAPLLVVTVPRPHPGAARIGAAVAELSAQFALGKLRHWQAPAFAAEIPMGFCDHPSVQHHRDLATTLVPVLKQTLRA